MAATTTNPYPQLLLLGDSILERAQLLHDGVCFQAGLAEHCRRRLDVINRGLSGYYTSLILAFLDTLMPSPAAAKVDYLVVLLGANDACLPDCPTGQHVPLEEYRANLIRIITHPAVTAHQPKILLVSPPPVHEPALQERLAEGETLSRRQAVTLRYANVVRDIVAEARDENVLLVDLWHAVMREAESRTPPHIRQQLGEGKLLGTLDAPESAEPGHRDGLRALLDDGLHLTGAGYQVFLDAMLPCVGPEWAQEVEGEESWIFPRWSVAPQVVSSLSAVQ